MANAGNHTYVIEYECGGGNEYDGRLGLRISSIFVIGFGSMLGALLPIAAARTKRMRVPPLAFFITKYFGSGVIIATAFIHLLSPANENLNSPCLTGAITEYDWAQGIVLMTIFLMFFIELMAARFDVFGTSHDHDHDIESSTSHRGRAEKRRDTPQIQLSPSPTQQRVSPNPSDPSNSHLFTSAATQPNATSSTPNSSNASEAEKESTDLRATQSIPGRRDDFSYPPGGVDHLGHQRDHSGSDGDHFAAQMTGIFILEFGVLFHSVFIGLTLAVAGENFTVLYIVLVFHQTFEGLGLGSRLATARWPAKKSWLPWILGAAYGISTPCAIAIGLGVRATFQPGSQRTMVVNGVFDAVSAGILIYTGLVELMAHEFMFNPEMRRSSGRMMGVACLCMCAGAGLMATLGRWA